MRRSVIGIVSLLAVILPSNQGWADFRHARMGPRPRAMGSAFVGVADDVNAVYWNPAGITHIERFEVTGCRTLLYAVDNLSNDYISGAYHWHGVAAFGVSWVRLDLEDIYHEDTINFAIARKAPFIKGLSIGGSVKIFSLSAPGYEKYNDPAYEGRDVKPSFDLGIHYRSKHRWTIGAVVYNINEPKLKLLKTTVHPDPVYRDIAIGVSYKFRDLLLVSYDIKSRYGDLDNTVGRIGSEIWFFEAVALRGGFEQENMTGGFGLKHNRWQIDVMLETHYELGNTYQFAATIRL
ncbi:MAG: hypothetical protein JSV33_03820 [bacterium]|nr:MAG: hypothetical protein JSV33_03820 [bacterium]